MEAFYVDYSYSSNDNYRYACIHLTQTIPSYTIALISMHGSILHRLFVFMHAYSLFRLFLAIQYHNSMHEAFYIDFF